MSKQREKICETCGKHFWGFLKSKKCYSCNVHKEIKTCEFCGKEFKGKNDQKYCSRNCCYKFHRENDIKIVKVRNGYIPRFLILERDNFKCVYCGKSSIEDGVKLHVDHIIPIYLGGSSDLDNLITSCEECNISKKAKSLSEEIINRLKKHTNKI